MDPGNQTDPWKPHWATLVLYGQVGYLWECMLFFVGMGVSPALGAAHMARWRQQRTKLAHTIQVGERAYGRGWSTLPGTWGLIRGGWCSEFRSLGRSLSALESDWLGSDPWFPEVFLIDVSLEEFSLFSELKYCFLN